MYSTCCRSSTYELSVENHRHHHVVLPSALRHISNCDDCALLSLTYSLNVYTTAVGYLQLMIGRGPDVAALAANVKDLLELLGGLGRSLLQAMPPGGGRVWKSAVEMLQAVPPVQP